MFPSSPIRLSRGVVRMSALAILLAGTTALAEATYDVQVPYNLTGLSSALVSPRGIAVAPDGTVYAADVQSSTTGRVVMVTPSGTVGGASGGAASLTVTTVTTVVPSVGGSPVTLVNPNAVAVDSAGHLYIADIKADKVYELTSPETSSNATVLTYAGTGPTALATDASNNLYVADTNGSIYKFVGGTGTALSLSSATLQPVGLAVDAAGDVLFASAATNNIYEYSAAGVTSVYLTSPSTGTFHFSAATSGLPIGMGFDPAGNLYVLDAGSTDLWQINPVTPTTNYMIPFSASTTAPGSLSVSNIGNLYISDDSTSGGASPSLAELFYNNNPVNVGTLPAGTNSPLLNANFSFYTADTSLVTYEVMNGDNTSELSAVSHSGTCTGEVGVCNVQLVANYLASDPGLRNGVIGAIDAAKNVFAVHIVGICEAASLALYPGTQSILSASSSQTLYEPQGSAVTGNGETFFIADEGGVFTGSTPTYPYPAVYAYTVAGGIPTGTPATVGSFTYPMAVAVDSYGNLYVADYSGYVTKFAPTYNTATFATTWTGFGTRLTLPANAALTHPMSLTVDIYNNLYIGDMGPAGVNASAGNPGYIVKVPGDGGPATRLNYSIGGAPVIFPLGLTTDSYGNLFIADGGDGVSSGGNVDVVPITTGQASTIGFGSFAPLNVPSAVGFDAANDLYVLDSYNQRILVVPFTYSGTVPTAQSASIAPLGGSSGLSGLSTVVTGTNLVVWPNQNTITVTDEGYQTSSGTSYPVQVLTLTANASANLTTSSPSASFTGINVGNEQITFEAPGNTNAASFSYTGCGSTAGSTLATGATNACSSTVSFTGTGTGQSTTITLNGNPADDGSSLGNTIAVNGPPVPPIPIAQISPTSSTTSQTGTITVSNIGGGTLTITAINISGGTTTIGTNPCATGTTLTNVQTCTITWSIPTPSCHVEFGTCTATNTETITVISNGQSPTNSLTGTYSYSEQYLCAFGACIGLGNLAVPARSGPPALGGLAAPTSRGSASPALGGAAAPTSRNSTSPVFTDLTFKP